MDPDLSALAGLYTRSLATHGATPAGIGWRSEESQALRFGRLAMLLPETGTHFSVNDIGCGYGSLHDALRDAGHSFDYTGYEISEEMLERCRRRLPAPTRLVLSPEPVHTADYSFASGIFNVRLNASVERWEAYIEASVKAMAARSAKGFAFNLLTAAVDYRQDDLYYGDPVRWFEWCRREITPRVGLLHDYPLFEWTMLCRFDESPAGEGGPLRPDPATPQTG